MAENPHSVFQKFASKIMLDETGCWLWTGTLTPKGYGTFYVKSKLIHPHRFSWEYFKGPIPKGLVIDHMCRIRSCVNPDHLRVVTTRVNTTENSISIVAINLRKTHCPRGHEYTPENTYIKLGRYGWPYRTCRKCLRVAARQYRARVREKKYA